MKASRPADARRLPQPCGTCRRISTSSQPAATLQWHRARLDEDSRRPRTSAGRMAGLPETAAKVRDPGTVTRISVLTTGSGVSVNRDRTASAGRAPPDRGTMLLHVRKREAIRILVRRPDPATRLARQPDAEIATVMVAAGRNFHRCRRGPLMNPQAAVGRPAAPRPAVRMVLPAV